MTSPYGFSSRGAVNSSPKLTCRHATMSLTSVTNWSAKLGTGCFAWSPGCCSWPSWTGLCSMATPIPCRSTNTATEHRPAAVGSMHCTNHGNRLTLVFLVSSTLCRCVELGSECRCLRIGSSGGLHHLSIRRRRALGLVGEDVWEPLDRKGVVVIRSSSGREASR
jgi:hypothetical protein